MRNPILKAVLILGLVSLICGSLFSATAQRRLSDGNFGRGHNPLSLTPEGQYALREFQRVSRERQLILLKEAREEFETLEQTNQDRELLIEENNQKIEKVESDLRSKASAHGELLSQFRKSAGEVSFTLNRSFANFELSGRVEEIRRVAEKRSLPTPAELGALPTAILAEMKAQSEVKKFTAEIVNTNSNAAIETREIMRVGNFIAATTDSQEFLSVVRLKNRTGSYKYVLATLLGQPQQEVRLSMMDLINAEEGNIIRTPINPTQKRLFFVTDWDLSPR